MNCYDEKGNTINHLTQWEQGRELTVKDLSPDKTYIAHVFNNYSAKAKVVPATNVGGNVTFPVPNILLQEPYTLLAVVYEKQGTKRLSVGKIILNVESAAMPEDYEFVENIEYTDWVELTAEARTLLDQLQTDAQAIERIITPVKANNLGALVVENNVKGNPILLKDSADAKVVDLEITGSTTQNGVPSVESPAEIVNGNCDSIGYNGKNLFDENYKLIQPQHIRYYYRSGFVLKKGVTYCLNTDASTKGGGFKLAIFDFENSTQIITVDSKQFLTYTPDADIKVKFDLFVRDECKNEKMWLTVGSVATPYEPYKGETITFSSPVPLAEGDKVFKDADGSWKVSNTWLIPDEYIVNDFQKIGTYTRVRMKYPDVSGEKSYSNVFPYETSFGSDTLHFFVAGLWTYVFIPSTGINSKQDIINYLTSINAKFQLKTLTPSIKALPKEDSDNLDKVMTFYPNSTVQTNSGIELNLKYVADTKNYIDKKFNELQTAIVAVGGNV